MTGFNYDPKRIILFSNEVDEITISNIIRKILKINAKDRVYEDTDPTYNSPIHIVINCTGGNVHDGIALIGAIETSITEIHITCLGSVQSMGLFILLAGHKRFAHNMATFMYHDSSLQIDGQVKTLKNELKELERLDDNLNKMLFGRSKVTEKMLTYKMKDKTEWYFTAKEAQRLKIIDKIL